MRFVGLFLAFTAGGFFSLVLSHVNPVRVYVGLDEVSDACKEKAKAYGDISRSFFYDKDGTLWCLRESTYNKVKQVLDANHLTTLKQGK